MKVILEHFRYNEAMVYDSAYYTKIQNIERMCGDSPKMLWAKANGCKIERQQASFPLVDDNVVAFTTDLTDIQATEFTLRF